MVRVVLFAAPLLFAASTVLPPPPASAEAQSVSRTGEQCQEQRQERRRTGRRIGGILGGIASNFGGHVGGVAGAVTGYLPVGELLGEAIASMLDCDEQQKAAGATQKVVEEASAERSAVGTTATWESTTRPGVHGSSTVTAQDDDGCMTVTDVVIVDGEETRAPKRMCRRPPSNRYVRV